MSTTITPAHARDILERVGRQLVQTYGPALVVVLTSIVAGHSTAKAAAVALFTIVLATTVKAMSGLRAGAGAPLGVVILDRAGSALGAELLGLGVTDWFGLIHLDWDKAITAAVASGAVALLMYYVTPPTVPPTPVEPAPDGSYDVTSTDGGESSETLDPDYRAPSDGDGRAL